MTFSQRAVEAAAAHILRELDDRGLLKGVDDDLFSEIGNDVAKAALTAALAVDGVALQGWQPIDSAPKDGRYIITGRFRDDELKWVKHSRWMSAEEAFEEEGGASADDYDAGWTDGEDEHDYCYPTHWQPLPPPPAASDREERR